MTILAICPYCKAGRIRAPRAALGASATCPRCQNCFTLADTEEAKRNTTGPLATKPLAPVKTVPTPDARRVAAGPAEWIGEQPDDIPEFIVPELPAQVEYREPADDVRAGSSGFALAMLAIILAGLAFGATQLPYGRFIALVLALVGLAMALLALVSSDGQWQWPALGCAANGGALFLVVLLPSWLDLGPWWPERIEDDSHLVKSINFRGGATLVEGEWVDASKGAWQQNDVRVTVSATRAGKLELIGPKEKHEWSKGRVLALSIRVANVGVVRRLDYRSWNDTPGKDEAPLRVVLPDGKTLAPAKLPAGWVVPGRIRNADLFPGKTADDVLVFEVPPGDVEYVRLELPGWAIGSKEPVKLHVPRSMIVVTR